MSLNKNTNSDIYRVIPRNLIINKRQKNCGGGVFHDLKGLTTLSVLIASQYMRADIFQRKVYDKISRNDPIDVTVCIFVQAYFVWGDCDRN